MRLAEVQNRLSDVSNRLSEVSERYQVPERVSAASQKVAEGVSAGVSAASEAARRGAKVAYHFARENPRTSIGAAVVAAAMVGGLLWYLFADPERPVERRRKGVRVRARTERRRRHAGRAAA